MSRPTVRRSSAWVPVSAFAAACSATGSAHAYDAEVTAQTAAQSYDVRSPWGDPAIARRRFTQTLGLGVWNLGGDAEPGTADWSARVRVRVDADFGITDEELAYAPSSGRFVPTTRRAPVDVMYAYVEGRRLAGGWLGLRGGRQYRTDALGMWSFDGALARAASARAHLAIEAYGGFEQRGGLPLSTSRWQPAGLWRGDRVGYDAWVYPELAQPALAPAWGVSAETLALPVVHARVDYRKVWNRDVAAVSLLPDPITGQLAATSGARVSTERTGASLDATLARIGSAQAGAVYDLYDAGLSRIWAGADALATRTLTVGADFDWYRPVFDADSIWNFFARGPSRTTTGRLAWAPSRRFDLAASAGAKSFSTEGDPTAPATTVVDALGTVAARLRFARTSLGLRGGWDAGERGRRVGGDLSGERAFSGGRWGAIARTSLWTWQDAEREDRDATSFGYVVGGTFRPAPSTRLAVEWEHDMNRLVGQRYRVLALLDVWVTR